MTKRFPVKPVLVGFLFVVPEADEDVLGEAQKSLSRQIPGRMDMSSVQGPPVGWVI